MRSFLIPAIAAAMVASSSVAYAVPEITHGYVVGKIVDMDGSTVALNGGRIYRLPPGFDSTGFETGQLVAISWSQESENHLDEMVDSIRLVE